MNRCLVILGNQLFPPKHVNAYKNVPVYMAEDVELCTYQRHHQQKLLLFLGSMRKYAIQLEEKGFQVTYRSLPSGKAQASYEASLLKHLAKIEAKEVITFEIEDVFFERRFADMIERHGLKWTVLTSPMFLTSREDFQAYLNEHSKPFMKTFYEAQRKRLDVLLDKESKPVGGKWSFDAENRKKLPKNQDLPGGVLESSEDDVLASVCQSIGELFSDHPGEAKGLVFPTDRKGYLKLLRHFCQEKLVLFGPYQDALSDRDPFLFHACLTPGLNLGLITPDEVLDAVLAAYQENPELPLSSVEGFVRQLIGWREFVRGIHRHFSDKQTETNFFDHDRKMKPCWYQGRTGLPPLDRAIKKALTFGYAHHIERLMVLSNAMLLCEIHPHQVYAWFMEMFVDSSDWVMGPNVYGMGQFSDGGVFATKPYISGSNYLLKMGEGPKGPWCEVWDGLYWRFISKNRRFYEKNPRSSMMVGLLDKMDSDKKARIFAKAEQFISEVTS